MISGNGYMVEFERGTWLPVAFFAPCFSLAATALDLGGQPNLNVIGNVVTLVLADGRLQPTSGRVRRATQSELDGNDAAPV